VVVARWVRRWDERPVLAVLRRALASYGAHACGIYAGAIAFFGLLSLFPLILLLISLVTTLLRASNSTALVLGRITLFFPGSATLVVGAMRDGRFCDGSPPGQRDIQQRGKQAGDKADGKTAGEMPAAAGGGEGRGRRRRSSAPPGQQAGGGPEDPADQLVEESHREHPGQGLGEEQTHAAKPEQLDTGNLDPEPERRFVHREKTARIEGDEEKIMPTGQHALPS